MPSHDREICWICPEEESLADAVWYSRSRGAQLFCAIRSYLATAAKHDVSFFDALLMLTGGLPWIPDPA